MRSMLKATLGTSTSRSTGCSHGVALGKSLAVAIDAACSGRAQSSPPRSKALLHLRAPGARRDRPGCTDGGRRPGHQGRARAAGACCIEVRDRRRVPPPLLITASSTAELGDISIDTVGVRRAGAGHARVVPRHAAGRHDLKPRGADQLINVADFEFICAHTKLISARSPFPAPRTALSRRRHARPHEPSPAPRRSPSMTARTSVDPPSSSRTASPSGARRSAARPPARRGRSAEPARRPPRKPRPAPLPWARRRAPLAPEQAHPELLLEPLPLGPRPNRKPHEPLVLMPMPKHPRAPGRLPRPRRGGLKADARTPRRLSA